MQRLTPTRSFFFVFYIQFKVNKVLFELTEGALGEMPQVGQSELTAKETEEDIDVDDEMLNRLAGLRAAT